MCVCVMGRYKNRRTAELGKDKGGDDKLELSFNPFLIKIIIITQISFFLFLVLVLHRLIIFHIFFLIHYSTVLLVDIHPMHRAADDQRHYLGVEEALEEAPLTWDCGPEFG